MRRVFLVLKKICEDYIVAAKKTEPIVELGQYIEQTDERNVQSANGVKDVVGMSITKLIIPTKANVKNTDLEQFIIVNPKKLVYNPCTHEKKIGLGFNYSENSLVLISWNNISFRVKPNKRNVFIPEYLYIIFCRNE